MVKRFARWLFSRSMQKDVEPWASFEIVGFEPDGRMKVEFDYNAAFLTKIKGLGYQAETDEDTVQLFFYTCTMRPTEMEGMGTDAHPGLKDGPSNMRVIT